MRVRFTFIAYLFLLLLPVWLVSPVRALTSSDIAKVADTPESTFKSRYLLQTDGLVDTIPKVGELVLPKGTTRGELYLVDASTGTPQGFLYRSTAENVKTPYSVKVGSKQEASLSDDNPTTGSSFAIKPDNVTPQFSDVEITLQKPTALSGVRMSLDSLSQTPQTVTIKGLDTTQSADQVVFINQLPYQPLLRFPTQTVTKLLVTLSYSQPLRLTEVGLVEANQDNSREQEKIRFLIRPKSNYVLYFNRDQQQRRVVPQVEAGNFFAEQTVISIAAPVSESNPLYKPADADRDEVLDAQDNCPTIANPAQTDGNKNGVGDECEDFDADGVINATDNCGEVANAAQSDTDGDSIGDACDQTESRLTEQRPWLPWAAMGITAVLIAGLFYSVLRSKQYSPVQKLPTTRKN